MTDKPTDTDAAHRLLDCRDVSAFAADLDRMADDAEAAGCCRYAVVLRERAAMFGHVAAVQRSRWHDALGAAVEATRLPIDAARTVLLRGALFEVAEANDLVILRADELRRLAGG